MRTILYTGKGGVGKTSVAAATAVRAAGSGKKVLVMSTPRALALRRLRQTRRAGAAGDARGFVRSGDGSGGHDPGPLGGGFYDSVASVGEVLTDPETTSVRIMTNVEKMVIAESRRAYTYLNLYDYAVDAVVVNRLLPDSLSDPTSRGGARRKHATS